MAVVNMDWDRIKAVDLFILFDSFKPQGGCIESVKIVVSEFGKKRLEQEAIIGPPAEIFAKGSENAEEDQTKEDYLRSSFKSSNEEEFNRDALRKYQLERLR